LNTLKPIEPASASSPGSATFSCEAQATHGEGSQNLLCAYLAGAVLLGLAGNALFGWWWLDPIAALAIAGVALKDGVETWKGEGCCMAPSLTPGRRL
jgi:hypothetical protein